MPKSTLGADLVENFKLLLELVPDEECSKYVDENMFLRQDKRVFHKVMSYILHLITPNCKSSMPSQLLTKQDERIFYNGLCEHLKKLRMKCPEADLPLLTPSSMVYFHGDKCRDILLKITNAVMLKIMKDDNFDIDIDAQENNLDEFERLRHENSKSRDELENIDQINAKEVARRVHILNLIVSAGRWDEMTKLKLMDIDDNSIISDIKNGNTALERELSILEENILPFLLHAYHKISGETCECDPALNMSSRTFSNICEIIWESTRKSIEAHIKHLKCISEVKSMRWEEEKGKLENVKFSDEVSLELIKKLENLIHGNEERRLSESSLLFDSPITLKDCSLTGDNISFSPMSTGDWLNFKKQATKLNIASFADYVKPVKISVSPIDPLNCILPQVPNKRPASNESVTTIVQRMRSKATPSKFSKQSNSSTCSSISSSLFSKVSMSACKEFRNFDKLTPLSKHSELQVSQSTNRRQSMGFVKPSNCYVRKRLNPLSINEERASALFQVKEVEDVGHNGIASIDGCSRRSLKDSSTSVSKEQVNAPSIEKQDFLFSNAKSENTRTLKDGYSDEVFDMIARKMVEEDNSFSDNNSGMLDFSLSGVECLPSSPIGEIKFKKIENDVEPLEMQQLPSPQTFTNLSTVIAEIIEEEKEINCSLHCALDEDLLTIDSDSDSCHESEIFLDPIEISKGKRKSVTRQLPESTKKTPRSSLGLLIERFKAIKKNSEANGE